MLKLSFMAGITAAVLMADPALAQTAAPTQPVGSTQVMTQMPSELMRGSRLIGIDVYGADNQKIGDIDEVLVDRQGKIHALVVGVGGFLGIGQKDVAIPFDQIQWLSNQEVQASSSTSQSGYGINTAGGVTMPSTATGGSHQATATGSPAAGGPSGVAGGMVPTGSTNVAANVGNDPNTPARAMVKMTKGDLQGAPEFRYSNDVNRAGSTGNTNPPPQNVNTPGNIPPNTPRQ